MTRLTVPEAARAAGVVSNTIKNWIDKHDCPAHDYQGTKLIDLTELKVFVADNPQLRATRRAAARLDVGERDTVQQPPASDSPVASGPRDQVRALRAQVATLSEELDVALRDLRRVLKERDLWRARTAAHRDSMRAQLDLEELADKNT